MKKQIVTIIGFLLVVTTCGASQIKAKLEFQKETPWDEDNDGTELKGDIIDMKLKPEQTIYDNKNLCSLWKTENLATSNMICQGASHCCSFLGLMPQTSVWDTYHANFAKNGAADLNMISARLLYVDYNTGIEDIDIKHSDWKTLPLAFLPAYKDIPISITISKPRYIASPLSVLLTNYGKSKLENVPVLVRFHPCVQTGASLAQTINIESKETIRLDYQLTRTCEDAFVQVIAGKASAFQRIP